MSRKKTLLYGVFPLLLLLALGSLLLLKANEGKTNQDREKAPEVSHVPLNPGMESAENPKSPPSTNATTSSQENDDPVPAEVDILEDLPMDFQKDFKKAEDDIAWEQHLRDVEITDREIYSKWEMPESQIAKASSQVLLSHFISSPLPVSFLLYGDTNKGIERVLRSCKTLQAFVDRPDIAVAVAAFHEKFPYSPDLRSEEDKTHLESVRSNLAQHKYADHVQSEENEAGLIIARRSIQLYHMDHLLLYPSVFSRLKGHEKRILDVLLERFHAIEVVRSKYGEDAYSAASSTAYNLSVALLKNIDPGLAKKAEEVDFSSDNWEKDHYAYLELCRKRLWAEP